MRAKAASAKPAPATPPSTQPASVEVSGVAPAGSIPSAEAGRQEEQEAPDWGEDQEMPARSPTPPEEVKAERESNVKAEQDVAVTDPSVAVSGGDPASQGVNDESASEPDVSIPADYSEFVTVINKRLQDRGFKSPEQISASLEGNQVRPEDITSLSKRRFQKYVDDVLKASNQSVSDIVERHTAFVKEAQLLAKQVE